MRRDDAIARIELDRPERLNALNGALVQRIQAALVEAERSDVRAVILTGQGRAFCSGSDLAENFADGAPPAEQNLRTSRHPLLLAMRALPKPILTAVNGVAAGIGIGLALAGDLVVARESASFNFAFTKIGLVPDGGAMFFLQNAVGRPRAQRIALLGESVGAREAEEIGLIARCFPDDEFEAGVEQLATRLAAGPTRAYGLLKRAIDGAGVNDFASQLELEATLQAVAARSEDFAEGREAFLGKREAEFEGR